MPTPEERDELCRLDIEAPLRIPKSLEDVVAQIESHVLPPVPPKNLLGSPEVRSVCICTAIHTNRDCPMHGKWIRCRE